MCVCKSMWASRFSVLFCTLTVFFFARAFDGVHKNEVAFQPWKRILFLFAVQLMGFYLNIIIIDALLSGCKRCTSV